MRILQLCKKFPYPLKDGESIAITYLARAFKELGHEVTLLAMNTSKHWCDTDTLPKHFNHYHEVHTVSIDNHLRPLDALKFLISKESYHIQRFIDPAFEAKLVGLLGNNTYDVIQLETLYLAPYIPAIRKHSKALVAMRAHNIEHEIWERIAANDGFFLKKWYLRQITPRLKAFEIGHLNTYDLMVGISDRDLSVFQKLGLKKPAITIPIGLDCRDYAPQPESFQRPLSLSFIGSLDWMPNVEGLTWFLDNVWQPLLHPRFPTLKLHIAGRNTPDWLKKSTYSNVVVHGEVDCAKKFINEHSVMIAPLLSGSGMRAKILEAMALGKVTISTTIGIEGIHAHDKQEVLIADKPEEFVTALQWCIEQGSALADVGHRAQVFSEKHYDNLEIGKKLLEVYAENRHLKPNLVLDALH